MAALIEGLRVEVRAQADRLALWRPVLFGAGAAFYFGLQEEPPALLPVGAMLVSLVLVALTAVWGRSRLVFHLAIAALCLTGGLSAACVRTRLVDTPTVPANLGAVTVEGAVIDIRSPSAERWRLLIAPSRIGGLAADALPARIRLVTAPGDLAAPGDLVRVVAILNPPPGPAGPGAYDFARDAYFERIGAVGASLSPVDVLGPASDGGLLDRCEMLVNRIRWELARRLAEDLSTLRGGMRPSTGLVVAVATSHEAWLPKADADSLRGSGLAHMLAIAGLHMAAVSGFVFWSVRLGIAAMPAVALRVPGKQVAAAAGLVAVLIYLLLSGAHPPARRAAITASVAFLAMLVGRQAVSLHSLSVAALVLLLLEPEGIIQPGFQMSFCATGALVALAEVWRPARERHGSAPAAIRLVQAARQGLIGLAVVATVAGLATGPFALQHFNRSALYGTPANLIADFLASAVLMPAVAVAAIGEALSLDHRLIDVALWPASLAADGVILTGTVFAHMPAAQMTVASAPAPALLVSFLGLVFAILWRGWLRGIGAICALAVMVWPRPPAPLAWIGPEGGNAAVVQRGVIIPMRPDRRQFATESFAQHRGLEISEDASRYDCNRDRCLAPATDRPRLAAWFTRRRPSAERLAELCDSDVMILRAPVTLPDACTRPLILRPETFRLYGAAEVTRVGVGWRLSWTSDDRGHRPWTRPPRRADAVGVSGSGE